LRSRGQDAGRSGTAAVADAHQRLGADIAALLQESLSVAHRTEAIETKDLERVVVDTTVQEEAIAHPTNARLTHPAIEKLVALAERAAPSFS
jgi:transposase, IS5 family